MRRINSIMSVICFMLSMAFIAFFLYALLERKNMNPIPLLYALGSFLTSRVFVQRAKNSKRE